MGIVIIFICTLGSSYHYMDSRESSSVCGYLLDTRCCLYLDTRELLLSMWTYESYCSLCMDTWESLTSLCGQRKSLLFMWKSGCPAVSVCDLRVFNISVWTKGVVNISTWTPGSRYRLHLDTWGSLSSPCAHMVVVIVFMWVLGSGSHYYMDTWESLWSLHTNLTVVIITMWTVGSEYSHYCVFVDSTGSHYHHYMHF